LGLCAAGSERIVSRCENSSGSCMVTTFFVAVRLSRCRACARDLRKSCRVSPATVVWRDSLENLFEIPHGAGKNGDQTSSGYRRFTRFRDVGFEEVRRKLPVVDVSDHFSVRANRCNPLYWAQLPYSGAAKCGAVDVP
jgi:hypothetical protein